jgi:uncharacterized Zn-finger protein
VVYGSTQESKSKGHSVLGNNNKLTIVQLCYRNAPAVQEDSPYKCKECDMSFTLGRDLIRHREYAKYRREGSCWQQNAFS